MDERPIGWLERVEPSRVWPGERADFVPWLAAPESLRRLGDALRLDLEPEALEQRVGRFRADLLCRDAASGSPVVIEAQLGPADHRHLGQLMAYAAGLDAAAAVWLAARFHDEHLVTLDWLNRPGAGFARFFAVEIAAWRAGDAGVAARFDVKARPPDWPAPAGERPPPRPQPV
ncbi:MAG: hypothetical protein OXI22_10480, partial [Defluviicoccus sp.]|nr:hypothetical protein [Defluviicoccus sp.]